MAERKAVITLSLAAWQKRTIQDHIKGVNALEISKLKISVIDQRQWVMYRQPTAGDLAKGAWNLYLTDAQIKAVGAKLGAGVNISALKLSADMVKSGAVVLV